MELNCKTNCKKHFFYFNYTFLLYKINLLMFKTLQTIILYTFLNDKKNELEDLNIIRVTISIQIYFIFISYVTEIPNS